MNIDLSLLIWNLVLWGFTYSTNSNLHGNELIWLQWSPCARLRRSICIYTRLPLRQRNECMLSNIDVYITDTKISIVLLKWLYPLYVSLVQNESIVGTEWHLTDVWHEEPRLATPSRMNSTWVHGITEAYSIPNTYLCPTSSFMYILYTYWYTYKRWLYLYVFFCFHLS